MQQMVTGQVGTLEQRQSGWVAVHMLVPGKQYPVKLSTKKPEIIGQAQAMQGQNVDALYNEVEGESINPHTGQPYINRYLEALAPAGQMQPPQQQPEMAAIPGLQPMAQLVPQNMPQPQAPVQQYVQQPVVQNPPFPPLPPQGVVTDTDREGRIMRQSAAKVAAELIAHRPLEERTLRTLVATSEQLVKYFRDGVSWTTNGEYEPGADDGDDIPF